MTRAGSAGALLAVALLLAGCGAGKAVVRYEEPGGLSGPPVGVVSRKTDLPPPKDDDEPEPPPPAAAVRSAVPIAASERGRMAPPSRRFHEPRTERYEGEPLRAESSTQAAPGSAGPPPEKMRAEGNPQVQHPDELTPLPTDRPQRYVSPAPLKKVLNPLRIGERRLAESSFAGESAVIDVSAAPTAFPPQATAALADEVPDSVVADPEQLGSYHVQVSSSRAFGAVLFDKEYAFMADIDLKTDLLALELRPGRYWIRYAVVDLLGFEHPYSRPQRILLRQPRAR